MEVVGISKGGGGENRGSNSVHGWFSKSFENQIPF